jgi:signal transduction histidine kinase
MRLNSKLLLNYVIVGSILLLVIGCYADITLKKEKFQSIHESFIAQLYQVDFAITDFLVGVEYDVKDLVANETVRTKDDHHFTQFLDADENTFEYNIGEKEQAIIDILNHYRINHPYANSVYMGRENGSFVRSHKRNRPTQYDPRERPWYQLAVSNPDEVMRTAPYRSVTTPDVNIGTVKALVDERGQVYGVVGIDVTLRNLTDYISNISVGEDSYIVLLDDNGIVLTGHEEARFKGYDEAGLNYFQVVMDNVTGYTSFEEESAENYLFYYTSPTLGWKICAVIPAQRVDHEVSQFVNGIMGLLTLSLFLLSVLTAMGVRRFIVKPIKELEQSTKTIIQTGDLDHRITIETNDEIGQLAVSFNKMVESIRRAHDELELRVVERTAELSDTNAALQQEITERKRAEEALRRRNHDLALLNRMGQALTATLDLQQITDQLQQAVTEIIGVEGCSIWLWDEERPGWLICRAASHPSLDRSPVNMCLRPGQGIAGWVAQNEESAVVPRVQDDPRFFPDIDAQTGFHTGSLLAVPLRVRDMVVGVLEAVNRLSGHFDADDRALLETLAASAAIAIDNARLVETLRQQTVELQAHNDELDAFARTVAHDLKNPLTAIIGIADVLKEDYVIMPDKNLEEYLHTIARSGRRMKNIIDELLMLAGVRKMEAEMRPLDMAGIVDEAQQRLDYLIKKHQAEIILPKSWPVALGYGPWVEEVWANYLSNALKYGGRPPRVELGAAAQADGTVRFWVRDNGPGITPEDQARLFIPFTRLDQIRAKGQGLGLSIVRRIVEKLGGQVGVESEAGRGSLFTFTLPGTRQ